MELFEDLAEPFMGLAVQAAFRGAVLQDDAGSPGVPGRVGPFASPAARAYAAAEGIDFDICGKVIVAVDRRELPALPWWSSCRPAIFRASAP